VNTLKQRGALVLCVVIMSCGSIVAHDMWIEPTFFMPPAGKIIGVRLKVGQDFLGDPIPRDPALINEFISVDRNGVKPIIGHDGSDPAGLVRIAEPGMLILGYRSNPSPVTLPAAKFNQYLQEEGLDTIASLRIARNQTTNDAKEIFSRCAKSLVLSGPAAESSGDRRLGFTLELVAERNPYGLRADQDLPVRLTYESRPLGGALVIAINRLNPGDKMSARTDADGRVRFKLRRDGMWLIKAVHMVPAPPDAHAEWASFWASLTFDAPPGDRAAATRKSGS